MIPFDDVGGGDWPFPRSAGGGSGGSGGGVVPGVPTAQNQFFPILPSMGSGGGIRNLGNDFFGVSPISPAFTQQFFNFLGNQIGRGATPFEGPLSAEQNDLLRALEGFLGGGDAGGASWLASLKEMSETGAPIDQTPAWQAMVEAMQRNIDRGSADLKEQFAFGGALAGSPFAQAMTDYMGQASKDQNAMLLAAQMAALENAAGRKTQASSFLTGLQGNMAEYLQGLSQDDLDRMYQEFLRTQPENSPLLNMMFGGATMFPPILSKNYGVGATGALLQGIGSLAQAGADIWKIFGGGNKSGGGGGGSSSITANLPNISVRPGGIGIGF